MNDKKKIFYFISINKKNEDFILQESNLISLKIPKEWQKLNNDLKTDNLWDCHLPKNSLGIVYVSLYPNKLIIKKIPEGEEEKYKLEKNENLLIIYKGRLEPNGENNEEKFYRIKLKLKESKKEAEKESLLIIISFLIIGASLIIVICNSKVL